MAQRVEVVLIDDIDGGKAAETVTFALDGVSYEIDLSDKNAKQAARRLRDMDRSCASRRVRPRPPRVVARGAAPRSEPTSARSASGPAPTATTVSDRGRISADIQAAYDKAH